MSPIQRLSRPLPLSAFSTAARCRPVANNAISNQSCISQPFLRALHLHKHLRCSPKTYLTSARLFSSKISQTTSTNAPTIMDQMHSIFQSITLFLPRVIAFCGTIHVTTEYGFNTVRCEGPSMEPTIIDGSFTCVLIDKFSHRIFGLEKSDDCNYRRSFITNDCSNDDLKESKNNDNDGTWLSVLKGVWEQHFTSGLQRGDVVILHHPFKEATICKRIIGMPGDTIVRSDGGSRESNHRVKVERGHLWIEGDNTLQSHDSRAYGAVPASLIIGKVVCRLWPLREYASLGLDANGMEHWQRVPGRIGRGERPLPLKKNEGFEGSFVSRNKKC